MAEEYFMKHPCKHCPFRRDVKPFLHPSRGEELAIHATSKECAGFMTLQINEGASVPEGFSPAFDLVYGDCYEMIDAYENQ